MSGAEKAAGSVTPPASEANEEAFSVLTRRLLVIVNQLKLASKDFGDLASIPPDYVPAAHVVQEATADLDHLYDGFDEWEVAQSHHAMSATEKVVRPVTSQALRQAVEEQRSKLINVLGAVQCMKVAIAHDTHREITVELQGAVELLEDEVQRIVTALDERSLLQPIEASTEAEVCAVGRFTDGDPERTPFPGLPPALPCPFCGHHDDIMISEEDAPLSQGGKWYRVNCGHCGVDAPGGDTLLKAATEWNTRPGKEAP